MVQPRMPSSGRNIDGSGTAPTCAANVPDPVVSVSGPSVVALEVKNILTPERGPIDERGSYVANCVSEEYLEEFIHRLINLYVAPGGRLILGSYGSLSRDQSPFDLDMFLRSAGCQVPGSIAAPATNGNDVTCPSNALLIEVH